MVFAAIRELMKPIIRKKNLTLRTYGPDKIITGKVLPGHEPHFHIDQPGGHIRAPISTPEGFFPLIENRFDTIGFLSGTCL